MDYYEFIEKAGTEVTHEEYETLEFVYLNGPYEVIGSYVTAFCEWFKANGGMKAVYSILPFVQAKVEQDAKVEALKKQIETLKAENELLTKKNAVYDLLVSKETILEEVDKKMDKDALLLRLYETL